MIRFSSSLNSLLNRQLIISSKLKVRNCSDKTEKSKIETKLSDKKSTTISHDIETDLKKLEEVRQDLSNNDSNIYNEYKQHEKGFIYDKKPVKVNCKKGKIYMWCACGHSKHQVNIYDF